MKKVLAFILCCALVLSVAGCGGNKVSQDSSEKTKIVFWHTWNDEVLLSDIENYNKTNKDIMRK